MPHWVYGLLLGVGIIMMLLTIHEHLKGIYQIEKLLVNINESLKTTNIILKDNNEKLKKIIEK